MSYKALFAAIFLIAGCTTQQSGKAKITDPEIDVAQEVGPAELNYPVGPIELKYGFRITNQWTQPMTAIRIEVSTVNPAVGGGSYALRHDFYNVRETIPPGETRIVSIWARGYAYGPGMRQNEPVTLRAIVYFQTPEGSFQKVFIRNLLQGY